jgi:hypothetical protein
VVVWLKKGNRRMFSILKRVLFLTIAIYGSLIVKIVDSDILESHKGSSLNHVITDSEAFNQILLSSSKGARKEKFLLLNLIVDEEEKDTVYQYLPTPDLLVAKSVILKDLKLKVPLEIGVKESFSEESTHDQPENMYSVTVGNVGDAKELTKKVNKVLFSQKSS